MKQIIPMLPVRSMTESVAFYRKLGFEVERESEEWGWAKLRFGDCSLMMDQSIQPHPGAPRALVLYLYPEDVVEYHRHVRAQGVKIPDLDVTFYGMREFRIEDPDGNRLWIGQALAPLS